MYINSSSSVYLLQTVFNLYNSLALKLSIDNIQSVSLADKREGKKCSLVAAAGEAAGAKDCVGSGVVLVGCAIPSAFLFIPWGHELVPLLGRYCTCV